MPFSCSSSFYGSDNGYNTKSMTPNRRRSDSGYSKGYGGRTPVNFPLSATIRFRSLRFRISSWARMVSAPMIKHQTILNFETSLFKKEKISLAGHDEVMQWMEDTGTRPSNVMYQNILSFAQKSVGTEYAAVIQERVEESRSARIQQFMNYISDLKSRGTATVVPEFLSKHDWLNTTPLQLSRTWLNSSADVFYELKDFTLYTLLKNPSLEKSKGS